MSAPATIAITKLNYPETQESNTERQEDLELVDRCVYEVKVPQYMFMYMGYNILFYVI